MNARHGKLVYKNPLPPNLRQYQRTIVHKFKAAKGKSWCRFCLLHFNNENHSSEELVRYFDAASKEARS